MKLLDPSTDIIFLRISEHFELRLVGAQDHPIGTDPVQSDVGVVEEVGEVALAPPGWPLGGALIGHVQTEADKASEAARRIETRRAASEYPPIDAVLVPKSVFEFKRLVLSKGVGVGVQVGIPIIRMEVIDPAVSQFPFDRCP